MRCLPIGLLLLLSGPAAGSAQTPWEEIPEARDAAALAGDAGDLRQDFKVFFDVDEGVIPGGLTAGMNDLGNAQDGAWKAWARKVEPSHGLARIWIKYAHAGFDGSQLEAGQRANAVGLDVMICALSDPKNRGGGGEAMPEPPDSAVGWADTVARHVNELLREGVRVSHIEIWNEPDLRQHWSGTREEFGRFFALAGKRLREQLPPHLRIGGPGMASGWGGGRRMLDAVLDACVEYGFTPDFLSWHNYSSYATDQLAAGIPGGFLAECVERELPEPELIVSEWNIGLPNPSNSSLDNHENAAYFAAFTTTLAYTEVDHSCFFFLQDGSWDAREDYAGQSVGVFTLRGGPKAVLGGMDLTARACSLPRSRAWRYQAPWNLTLLATRDATDGERGYLLLANTSGNLEKRVRKVLGQGGVDLGSLRGKERVLRDYLAGQLELEDLGVPEGQQTLYERLRSETRALRHEMDGGEGRPVVLRFDRPPAGIGAVWVIDSTHGNPVADAGYREHFEALVASRHARASEQTVEELRKQGVSEDLLQALSKALADLPEGGRARRGRRPGRRFDLPGVSAETRAVAEVVYRERLAELVQEAPLTLSEHAAVQPGSFEPEEVLRRAGDDALLVDVPLHTTLLVECSWPPGTPPRPAAEVDAEQAAEAERDAGAGSGGGR